MLFVDNSLRDGGPSAVADFLGKITKKISIANEKIQTKRLELEYEEASKLEEAFAHSQVAADACPPPQPQLSRRPT